MYYIILASNHGLTFNAGFAATYYTNIQPHFLKKLQAALARFPGSDVYMNGEEVATSG